ncbi:MAG: hypothetical protein LVQ96_04045 [Thermoplasmatales archaeon]|nr:hypothetical protein [Thermoplasmatales archaeon]MCW6170325.1 hypothetical protein [Thermoplasmatales archaeon]
MVSIAFLALLKKYVSKAFKWLKISFIDPDSGNVIEINKNGMIKNSNNVVINNNIYMNINVDKTDKTYDKKDFKEFTRNLASGIENNEGYGVSFDSSVSVIHSTALSETQIRQIKILKRAEWPEEIFNALAIALKIINLEDKGKYDDAKTLMEKAFKSKLGSNIKKFYNLTRAGYLNGFVMDVMFSPANHGPKWISKILDYFPDAIFVDENSHVQDIAEEILKRQAENLKEISLYARGRKIEILTHAYSAYIDRNLQDHQSEKRSPFKMYVIVEDEDYTIGWSKAKRLVLKLEDVRETSIELLQKWRNDLNKI